MTDIFDAASAANESGCAFCEPLKFTPPARKPRSQSACSICRALGWTGPCCRSASIPPYLMEKRR